MSIANNSIVFDLDDTICYPDHSCKDAESKYGLAKPNKKIIEMMHTLKETGCYITISTARRMLTFDGNVEDILADVGEITIKWLKDNNVPYDTIHWGKPYSSTYYVDDKAMNLDMFYNWMENS